MPIKAIAVAVTIAMAYGATRINVRALLTSAFTGPGSISRIIAIVLVLCNLKNLPFIWHVSTAPYLPILEIDEVCLLEEDKPRIAFTYDLLPVSYSCRPTVDII